MAYQSLYRRYRPQKFGEVVGQESTTEAIRNAVREGRTGHAYLFSGPRGTGKTTSARILAKALNCTNLADGEPCGECDSCVSIGSGTSYDLQELDAASNNGVDKIRDLIEKAALGSPGRNKVYILDEVHMLSTAASNALLKTLEEPPDQVVFVLATTDPQKVLPTIRSRTQHFNFGLIGAADLEQHVKWVIQDAGLDVDDAGVAYVLKKGAGSARDTLSALDQVAAAGGVDDADGSVDDLMEALCTNEPGPALVAVAAAIRSGREPRVLAESIVERLRDAFLAVMGADLGYLAELEQQQARAWAGRMSPAAITGALENIGEALVEMRQAPDPRIPFEVALVKATQGGSDPRVAELERRVASLEQAMANGPVAQAAPAATAPPAQPNPAAQTPAAQAPAVPVVRPTSPAPASDPEPAARRPGPAEMARRRLAEAKGEVPPTPQPAQSAPAAQSPQSQAAPASPTPAPAQPDPAPAAVEPTPPPAMSEPSSVANEPSPQASPPQAPSPQASAPTDTPLLDAPGQPSQPAPAPGPFPTLEEISEAWHGGASESVPRLVKVLYGGGRFLRVEDGVVLFALPNEPHVKRCEAGRPEVESVLAAHFGRPIPLSLVEDTQPALIDTGPAAPTSQAPSEPPPEDDNRVADEIGNVHELENASEIAGTTFDRLNEAFPGAEVVEDDG